MIYTATNLMDEDINIFFQKQAEVLPSEIRKYIISGEWEHNLNAIIQRFNLSDTTAGVLMREVMLVFAGLAHPGVFRGEFASEINDIDDATIDAIVKEVSDSIFQPIRPALEKFFNEQDAASTPDREPQKEKEKITIPTSPSLVEPPRVWEKKPEVVPENLPTGETPAPHIPTPPPSEKVIPPPPIIQPNEQSSLSIVGAGENTHPFEEKMKKVFTGGMVDRGGLVLEKPTSEPVSGGSVVRSAHDPYREPIE